MESYIELLWKQAEFIDNTTPKQKELLKNANIVRENLESSLTQEQKALFEEFYKYTSEYHEIGEMQAFKLGYSYGTKVTSEALLFIKEDI